MSNPNVGFVGLGAMGFGMATHLVKQNYPVTGFDLYAPSLDRFKDAGGAVASSPADSARGKMFYICMVATAAQAQTVLFEGDNPIVPALPHAATLILCATIPATSAQSIQATIISLGRRDIAFIDAPVSGGAGRAAAGTLSIMASGSGSALKKGKFLLAEMSDTNKLYFVPGGIGAGSNMKMLHQVLAAIHILAASEAMGFAAHLGLDPKEVVNHVLSSDAWSWMHQNRAGRMIEEDYYPGVSALTIILKDVGIITAAARLHNFPTPLCSTAEQVFLTGLQLGFGSHDDAGAVRIYHPTPITKPSSTSNLTPESKTARLNLVIALLRNIHLCAAAEAVAFAKSLNVYIPQFYALVNAAAGGSQMFKTRGAEMVAGVSEKDVKESQSGGRSLDGAIVELAGVVQSARDLNCPLHLANSSLNLMLSVKRMGLGQAVDSIVIRAYSGL